MKTTEHKEKVAEGSIKRNRIGGCNGMKKSVTRTGCCHQKTAGGKKYIMTGDYCGVSPSSSAYEVVQQIPVRDQLCQETEKVLKLESQLGLRPSAKMKLQLFPIDEGTRIGLEKDGYNPYLELTLRAQKKIPSVIKHLNSKWGNSSVAQGELVLFPYNIQLEKLSTYKRWTLNDNGIGAADVHATIENSSVFRLRYGWFTNIKPKMTAVPPVSTCLDSSLKSAVLLKACGTTSELVGDRKENDRITGEDKPTNINQAADIDVAANISADADVAYANYADKIANGLPKPVLPWDDSLTNISIGCLLPDASLPDKISNSDSELKDNKSNSAPIQLVALDISIGGLLSEASLQGRTNNCEQKSNGSKLVSQPRMDKVLVQSSLPQEDSLTTLSIGGLLSEASLQLKVDNYDQISNGSQQRLQPSSLISDSLDTFDAGQLSSHPQESKTNHITQTSILDAEDTCHAFPFGKLPSLGKDAVHLSGIAATSNHNHDDSLKLSTANINSTHSGVLNDGSSLGLAGIKWTESLGPFDICLSKSRQITSGDSASIGEFVR
ncbi:hypothetical protein NMG60_11007168 [Bertholletia excelsa]